MVEGMGGESSIHYHRFKELACEAYNILRKSANLILNLFNLMLDADIHDISIERDKTILKVQEKFRLELSDEEAGAFFQSLITESVRALFPQIAETIHRWAQVYFLFSLLVIIFIIIIIIIIINFFLLSFNYFFLTNIINYYL